MKKIIDIETWKRRDNYRFFSDFLNPCISITSEVDCTVAKKRSSQNKQSFFLVYLYAILRAANEIEEWRYRIKRDGQVVLYEKLDVITPVQVSEDGKFTSVRLPWNEDFEKFHETARNIIKQADANEDPYAYTLERNILDDDNYDVILVSATPDLYFTSVTHTQEHRNGSDFPLMNVGKAISKEGRLVMPVAVNIHHGLMDGKHIADFFKKVQEYLM